MNLESSKTLGGIGAILVLVGAVAFFFDTFLTAIALIGLILIVVAMKGLADYYKENGIFTGTLLGFIVEIVGGVVTAALAIYIVFFTSIFTDFVHQIYPGWNGDWSSLANMTPTIDTSTITPQSTASLLGAVFLIFVVLGVFSFVATFLARRSLKLLAAKSGVGLFSTSAITMVIGGLFVILFALGFIIMLIGFIMLAFAFFRLKPQPEQPPAEMMAPQPSMPTPV